MIPRARAHVQRCARPEGQSVMEAAMLMLIGAMIGGPDSVLGGACTQDTCERAGAPAAVLATACGITNGFGSVGAIAQGPVTITVKDATHNGPT